MKRKTSLFLKSISIILLAVFISTAFSSCNKKTERFSITYTDTFDTVTVFTAYCSSQQEFDEAADRVHQELIRLDGIFDIYDDDSVLSKLNEEGTVSADKDLVEVLKSAKEIYKETNGKLNVGMGSVFSIWHQYREGEIRLPSYTELKEASLHSDLNDVNIDGSNITKTYDEMKLDLGSIAKGYATDRAIQKADISNCILNVGGNVVTKGLKDNSKKWAVGIEDPNGGIKTTVKVTDISVVTSGDYQRFREENGIRYHHIIDTETLFPSDRYRSVTVIYKDSMIADALSTALFCMSVEEGKALASKYKAEVMWQFEDGAVVKTGGFSAFEG